MTVKLVFKKPTTPIDDFKKNLIIQRDEPENSMVKSIRIRPELEFRYNEGVLGGFAKMCAECTGWMKRTCKEPKKVAEVHPGLRPCREYNLDARLCGATEAEVREAQTKQKIETKKEAPVKSGKKAGWQSTLERWYKKGKMPNPAFMNAKRWAYWEQLKKEQPRKEPINKVAETYVPKKKVKVRRQK